jgi:ketosteroid isomerase-like protein
MVTDTFYKFVDAINEHQIDKIYALMTVEHCFVDAQGNTIIGNDKMKHGWDGYFQLFPDCKIEISDIFIDGMTIAAFGFAGGTYKNLHSFRTPAAWKVIVEDEKIKLWQVYADTKIPFDLMENNQETP